MKGGLVDRAAARGGSPDYEWRLQVIDAQHAV